MGRVSFFSRFFGRGSTQSGDGGIYIRVKCDACGDEIHRSCARHDGQLDGLYYCSDTCLEGALEELRSKGA